MPGGGPGALTVSGGTKETLSRTKGKAGMPLVMGHQEGKEGSGRNLELGIRTPRVKTSFYHSLNL